MQERGMESDPRYGQLMQIARQYHMMQGGGQMPPQGMMMGGGQQMQQDPYGQGMMGMQRANMGPRMDPSQVIFDLFVIYSTLGLSMRLG